MSTIPTIFFAEREIPDEDWAQTPLSVRRTFEWLWQERERLREQTEKSSRNSSTPPSKDRLQHKKPRRKHATGRKPGGQPGHRGVTRSLVPADQVTDTIPVVPETCPCGHHFPADTPTEGKPYPHQVWDLPPILPTVIEYQLQHRPCPDCGQMVRAARPTGVPAGTLGPTVQALITLLTGKYHLSKRQVETLLRQVFGIPASPATICATEATVSTVLEDPVAKARTAVEQAPVKYVDESSWKQRRDPDPGTAKDTPLKTPWLWTATAPTIASIYLIRREHSQAIAREVLGFPADAPDYEGIVVSDRLHAYNILPLLIRQLCWAHLDRDFLAISERADPVAQRIGTELLEQADAVFAAWRQYRAGLLDFAALGTTLAPVKDTVARLLREGFYADEKTKTVCNNLLKLEAAMWTFLRVEGVEPTNNTAERAQRRGVMKRERTFGTQTSAGSRYVERILTTVATCQMHGTNTLAYLLEALQAHWHGQPIPVFFPT